MKYTLTVGEIDKMKFIESHWHANFKRLFANIVAGFRTTFVRVSHMYLENFHVSRTSRELVAKFLNRFKTFMQMFSSNCSAIVVIMKMKISHIRGKVVRHSPECLATVVRQSRDSR